MAQELSQQYGVFKRYVDGILKRRNLTGYVQQDTGSQKKLSRLVAGAFSELVCDFSDEIRRRELKDPNLKSLISENRFTDRRNQARQKLSALADRKFEDLAIEILKELEVRLGGALRPKKAAGISGTPQDSVGSDFGDTRQDSKFSRSRENSKGSRGTVDDTGGLDKNLYGERVRELSKIEASLSALQTNYQELSNDGRNTRKFIKELEERLQENVNSLRDVINELRVENADLRRSLESLLDKSQVQVKGSTKEGSYENHGEIMKSFLQISGELTSAAEAMDSSLLLANMKKFILNLKEITNEASSFKDMCETSEQFDELQTCREYVMVSSGNLVEIVKELSLSFSSSKKDVDLSPLESALEVTKNSVNLLAKLVRQLLLCLYNSSDQAKISTTEIEQAFRRWAVAPETLKRNSDILSNVLSRNTCFTSVSQIRPYLEKKISDIVPLIKTLIERFRNEDLENVEDLVNMIYNNFNSIVIDLRESKAVLPKDSSKGVLDILNDIDVTANTFSEVSAKFMEYPEDKKSVNEVSSLCYEMAKQVKGLFSLF